MRLALRPPASFALDPFVPLLPPRRHVVRLQPARLRARTRRARDPAGAPGRAVVRRLRPRPLRRGDARDAGLRPARPALLPAGGRPRRAVARRRATPATSATACGAATARSCRWGRGSRACRRPGRRPPPPTRRLPRPPRAATGSRHAARGAAMRSRVGPTSSAAGRWRRSCERRALGLGRAVRFHGFVPDHREVERILAGAPPSPSRRTGRRDTFTRLRRPRQAQGVPRGRAADRADGRAAERARARREAGAELVPDDAGRARRRDRARARVAGASGAGAGELALAYARRFDWNVLLGDALAELEREPARRIRRDRRPAWRRPRAAQRHRRAASGTERRRGGR